MSVEIKIFGEDAGHALRELVGLSGGLAPVKEASGTVELVREVVKGGEEPTEAGAEPEERKTAVAADGGRLYGSPAKGRARRSKEEMAEDADIEKLAELKGVDPTKYANTAAAKALDDLKHTPAAEAPANISTGEERIDPTSVEDAAQDAADEVAEVEAALDEKILTHDDVRQALSAYVKAFGMDAAMEDGPKVIAMLFGEGKVKVSDIPNEQVALAKAVSGIEEMRVKNPFGRRAV